MNQKKLSNVFIWGFLFLYLLIACISFCHAVQFFSIGNVKWMSVTLAFAFELGLALSLAAILLSEKNKKQSLPWILMIVLCFVQVVGNVYSTFKYISLSEVEYYQYLAKPLLFFIQDVDENTIQVIVSWIMGAILPIIALFMTDMVASNIKNMEEEKLELKKPNIDYDNDIVTIPTNNYSSPNEYYIPAKSNENIEQQESKETKNDNDNSDNILDYVDTLSTPNNLNNVEKNEDSIVKSTPVEIPVTSKPIVTPPTPSPAIPVKIPVINKPEEKIVVPGKPIVKKVDEPMTTHILETPRKENLGKKILGSIFDLGPSKKNIHVADDPYYKDPYLNK